jgi:hypothetical protein
MKSLFYFIFLSLFLQIRPPYTSSEKGRKVEIKMRQPSSEERRRKKKCWRIKKVIFRQSRGNHEYSVSQSVKISQYTLEYFNDERLSLSLSLLAAQLHSVYDEQQPLALGSLKPIPAPLPPPQHRGKHVTLHFAELLLRHPPPTHSKWGKIVAEFSNRFYFVNSGIIWPFCWRAHSLARSRTLLSLMLVSFDVARAAEDL